VLRGKSVHIPHWAQSFPFNYFNGGIVVVQVMCQHKIKETLRIKQTTFLSRTTISQHAKGLLVAVRWTDQDAWQAQLVECRANVARVMGSNPTLSAFFSLYNFNDGSGGCTGSICPNLLSERGRSIVVQCGDQACRHLVSSVGRMPR